MTVLTAIFIILSTILTIFSTLMLLNRTVPLSQTGAIIGVELGLAILMGALSACAMCFHWWLFGVILILLLGVWQLVIYHNTSWLVLLALSITTWIAMGQNALGGSPISLLAGRKVFLPLAILAYIAMSAFSYHKDHKDDAIIDAINRLRD